VSRRCTLGVDIGTSSAKGVLVAADGTILASATRAHSVSRPAIGHVEMDAATWWAEFTGISLELLATARADGADIEITAVGVSGMGPCLLLTDADDIPLRPAILYGVDTRATAQIGSLTAELGAAEIVALGGSPLSTQAVGPKLRWITEHEAAVAARARRLYMPASWLVARLTGAYVLDRHSASQCWPLYDLAAGTWHAPWWNRIAGDIVPPRLLWAGDVAGEVTAAAAAATGIPEGTPVIAGTIDAWSEAVSVGAVAPGDLMLMYGTTMFLVATTPEPVRHPAMWTTAGTAPGTASLAGGMATSGAITAWLSALFGGGAAGAGFAELTAEAEASGIGARGLLMLPYFAGERTPILDPDARGVIAGLDLEHTRGDLYRAALEATAFGVRHNVETMRAAGVRIDRVVAVGGGTAGRLWTRVVSDVTGLPQQIPAVTIGASFGAAYLAARSQADPPASVDEWNPMIELCEPDAEATALYDVRWPLYRDLYERTMPVIHELVAAGAPR
jgi:xylulokinase